MFKREMSTMKLDAAAICGIFFCVCVVTASESQLTCYPVRRPIWGILTSFFFYTYEYIFTVKNVNDVK